jgi:Na+/H+-dicarboxylate symporter
MAKRLTFYIMIGMVLGIIVGSLLHLAYSGSVLTPPELMTAEAKAALDGIAKYFGLVTDIFLRLIKMIIAPLVFATLVSGIVHMGDTASLGRVGAKTIGWFLGATVVSLTLGAVLVNLIQPGAGGGFPLPPIDATAGITKPDSDIFKIIAEMFPKSIAEGMANNTILQIVIFSLFFGVAMTAIGEKAAPITKAIDALVDVMLQVTDYVMRFSPFAVFAAMAKVIAIQGIGVIGTFITFIASFYFGLAILWLVLGLAAFVVIGKRAGTLIRYIREPVLLAFSTASSEAAYPRTLEALDRFGVPPKIASFVLPLGYSFNLDGSMMYMTFASIFIAQLYNVPLSMGDQISMLLILMITSKGMAAVPRASLVVISATLAQFNIPEAGLVLILAVDQFLDMGRSGTNVVGNAVAAAVVAKWEGELDPPEPPEIEPPHAPSSAHHSNNA